ncbi:hypothetical protein Pla163_17930 [Planctomycetes bacterium Pla163]|uniref:DUF4397 domain-containing protein n=1 Tax=Rohdeia mirabilis TaxID=2528008 RepID=A0A518CZM5_9BACT|nr:hypothetical protein Pla163_17930 [Planctomycetes bacterium Pla163]
MNTPSLALAATLSLASTAFAQDASLTVLHGVPGLPAPVEVVANGATLFSFCFEEQRGPLTLPPGSYDVEVRLEGATILGATYVLGAGDDVSVIANLDASGAPELTPFANDGSALALPSSRVTVRHAAEAPAVDVVVLQGGQTALTIPGVTNGQEASADVAPGDYEVELRLAGTSTVAFGPVPLTVEDGFRYGVHAVGQALTSNFDLLVQRDALTARVRSMEGLRFGNLVPSLYLDGTEVLKLDELVRTGVAVQPGSYLAEIRVFGGSSTLVSQQIDLAAGDDRMLLANPSFGTAIAFSDFANDVSALGLANEARVTVRHLALAPQVDVIVTANGAAVATIGGLVNGDEATAELPAGAYEVAIAPACTTTPVFGPVPLVLEARTHTIAQALGELGSTFTVGVDVIDLTPLPAAAEVLLRRFGTGCGATLTASTNCVIFDEVFQLELDTSVPNSAGVVLFGTSNTDFAGLPLPAGLAGFGATGCTLYTDYFGFRALPTDAQGRAVGDFSVPVRLAPFLDAIYLQGAIATPAGPGHFVTSNAIAVERN